MPELPEVETTVRGLRQKVLGRTFINFWTDSPKIIKKPSSLKKFKKEIKCKKIKKIERRGKNILFHLSGNKTLLIHQKISGHLLFGKWKKKGDSWQAPPGPLADKINSFIRVIFVFKNKQMMALSDLRKFAKVVLWDTIKLLESDSFRKLGQEPLERSFTFKKFKQALANRKNKIKQALMNQEIIAGIGNIYSDEILFKAKISPLRTVNSLKEKELRKTYSAIKSILKQAIKSKGDSFSDYRIITGEKGEFQETTKVYQKTGERCPRCKTIIKRIKIGGRSSHFCPKCQT